MKKTPDAAQNDDWWVRPWGGLYKSKSAAEREAIGMPFWAVVEERPGRFRIWLGERVR